MAHKLRLLMHSPRRYLSLHSKISNVIEIIPNVIEYPDSITYVTTFAERLRFARGLRRLTQAELARASGISQSAIANYESSARQFPKAIFRLASVLKVSAQWLAEGTGPMEHDAPALAASRLALADGKPAPPVLDWPFRDISPEIYWSLSDSDRDLVENTIAGLIASLLHKQ